MIGRLREIATNTFLLFGQEKLIEDRYCRDLGFPLLWTCDTIEPTVIEHNSSWFNIGTNVGIIYSSILPIYRTYMKIQIYHCTLKRLSRLLVHFWKFSKRKIRRSPAGQLWASVGMLRWGLCYRPREPNLKLLPAVTLAWWMSKTQSTSLFLCASVLARMKIPR